MTDEPARTGFLHELRRRNVVKVGSFYAMGGWLLIQIADIGLDAFDAPVWIMRTLLILVLGGFPLTLTGVWMLAGRAAGSRESNSLATFASLGVLLAICVGFYLYTDSRGPVSGVAAQAGDTGSSSRRDSSRATNPVVAVLPFTNMSSDAEKEFLVDGLTEDIITLLAQAPGLEVIARNSTFKYKGKNPDIRDVGTDLGADYVVEGSVRSVGDSLRVTVQVIDSDTGAHAWAEKYDRALADFYAVQDDVTLGIAAAVGDAVFREEYSRLTPSRTDNLNAWALTSRADKSFNIGLTTQDDSVGLAREAVAADPNYALAYAVLGRSLALRGLFELQPQSQAQSDEMAEAEAAARHAAKLAPDDPRVLAYLSITLLWSGKPEEALPAAQRAVKLSPSYAEGLAYLGDILIHNGRSQEALPYLDKAIRLTPEAPQMPFYLICKGEALLHHGNFAEAEAVFLSASRLGTDTIILKYLAGAQLELGETDLARESLRQAIVRAQSSGRSGSVADDARVMAYYSSDQGGPNFLRIWAGLQRLETQLRGQGLISLEERTGNVSAGSQP